MDPSWENQSTKLGAASIFMTMGSILARSHTSSPTKNQPSPVKALSSPIKALWDFATHFFVSKTHCNSSQDSINDSWPSECTHGIGICPTGDHVEVGTQSRFHRDGFETDNKNLSPDMRAAHTNSWMPTGMAWMENKQHGQQGNTEAIVPSQRHSWKRWQKPIFD